MPFEIQPIQPPRAVDASRARTAPTPARAPEAAPSPVEFEIDLSPGPEPFDAERVEVIRKALQSGTYPIFPAKIADALIAAGIALTLPQ